MVLVRQPLVAVGFIMAAKRKRRKSAEGGQVERIGHRCFHSIHRISVRGSSFAWGEAISIKMA